MEQTKVLIIERLKVLFDAINVLFQNKLTNRRDDEVIALVKSTTISIYFMLKPKISEYIDQKRKLGAMNEMAQSFVTLIEKMDSTITNPSLMQIEDALYVAEVLNIFCHEYGVTRITYFTGTATPSEKDIYRL